MQPGQWPRGVLMSEGRLCRRAAWVWSHGRL